MEQANRLASMIGEELLNPLGDLFRDRLDHRSGSALWGLRNHPCFLACSLAPTSLRASDA
jgi:hypothetical protein